LTLVIHVEIPRDPDALQHRSGRTGRAGKKGTAVLIVPHPRRRRVEAMLREARVTADWISMPTPEAIRAQDHERLLTALLEPVETDDEDKALAARLLAERTPEDIAAALVRMHRAKMPEAEELLDASARPARPDGPRPGFEDTVWFKMDCGRRHNADPRWILPLLCRRGHITRGEIGAIRISATETFFQVTRASADRFADALKRTKGTEGEDGIHIAPHHGESPDAHQSRGPVRNGPNRPTPNRPVPHRGAPGGAGKPPYRAKPNRAPR